MGNRRERRITQKQTTKKEAMVERIDRLEKAFNQMYTEFVSLRKGYIHLSEALFMKEILSKDDLRKAAKSVVETTNQAREFIQKVKEELAKSPEEDSSLTLKDVADKSINFQIHMSLYKMPQEVLLEYIKVLVNAIDSKDISAEEKLDIARFHGVDSVYRSLLVERKDIDANNSSGVGAEG